MKKITLIFFVLLINYNCKAQNSTINLNEATINDIQFYGKEVTIVVQNLGTPISIKDYYLETDKKMSKVYTYSNIIFYIINNRVDSFVIIGNSVLFSSHHIKIGDDIENLQSIYPTNFSNKGERNLILPIDDIDRFINISFNEITKKITRIALHTY